MVFPKVKVVRRAVGPLAKRYWMSDRSPHIWANVSRTRSDCCPEPPSTVTSAPKRDSLGESKECEQGGFTSEPPRGFPDGDGIPCKIGIAEGLGRGLMLRAAVNVRNPVAEGVFDEGEQFLVRARGHTSPLPFCARTDGRSLRIVLRLSRLSEFGICTLQSFVAHLSER